MSEEQESKSELLSEQRLMERKLATWSNLRPEQDLSATDTSVEGNTTVWSDVKRERASVSTLVTFSGSVIEITASWSIACSGSTRTSPLNTLEHENGNDSASLNQISPPNTTGGGSSAGSCCWSLENQREKNESYVLNRECVK